MTSTQHTTASHRTPANATWELSDARTLFLSDIHLGSRFCQAEPLLELLQRCLPQKIYLVGDVVDNRRMSRRIRWTPAYNRLVARLFDLGVSGTEIYYTPGNHDTFLRSFVEDYRLVQIRDSFVHQCADGKRLAVLHGDQFDMVESKMHWLSSLGSLAYEGLLAIDRSINAVLGLFGGRQIPISRSLKLWAKSIVQKKSGFHQQLCDFARDQDCEGVVCGHIHKPEITQIEEIMYLNTGDWIEHCSAIVEWPDGRLQLIDAHNLAKTQRREPTFHRLRSNA
ncbi:UDP-2,3-diacylglucosamine hydrolase [Rosistilla ulvae]|uniref:UDP-2,3-diacylglucosamine hydrolase n=1 Tax=Rosistilla ulvae TaxID=1930277 RepID=A0A517M3R6_9BACT|nr:UDP-2,3-diacylglucosamine diphosphatase [Rosistilla ulvae]QDS89523.1 UDP-2,3-diacylglucosamine hydrolase [Rosistilla ulvae]